VLAACLLLPSEPSSFRSRSWPRSATLLQPCSGRVGGLPLHRGDQRRLPGAGAVEEIGWRGFALPHLQRRYSALVSSLIVGLVWSFPGIPELLLLYATRLAIFVPMGMVMSVIYTWVYNSTWRKPVRRRGATRGDYLPRGSCTPAASFLTPTGVIYGAALRGHRGRGWCGDTGAANLSWRDLRRS